MSQIVTKMVPSIVVIYTPEREMHWIAYYTQQGAPLTNIVLPAERKPRASERGIQTSLDELELALSTYPKNRLLTTKGIASLLGIDTNTLCRLLKRKEIKGFKVGREWRFEEKDIEDFVQRQRAKTERSEGVA